MTRMWFFSSVNSLTLNELAFPESSYSYGICRVSPACELAGIRMLLDASCKRILSKMNVKEVPGEKRPLVS